MAEEKPENEEQQPDAKEKQPRKGGNKTLVIVIITLSLALTGGVFAYTKFLNHGGGAADPAKAEQEKQKHATKSALIALDPFVMNLAEQGRFLKVSMQFEIADAATLPVVTEKVPQLRDAIITLVSSKSADALASPEGKFQLKDEILLRANQSVGGGVTFKNLYFTEFVMQ